MVTMFSQLKVNLENSKAQLPEQVQAFKPKKIDTQCHQIVRLNYMFQIGKRFWYLKRFLFAMVLWMLFLYQYQGIQASLAFLVRNLIPIILQCVNYIILFQIEGKIEKA